MTLQIAGPLPQFTNEHRDKIRAGLKTQTRRLLHPQPSTDTTSYGFLSSDATWTAMNGDPKDSETWGITGEPIKPLYKVGSVYYLREPLCKTDGGIYAAQYYDDGKPVHMKGKWEWHRNTLPQKAMPKRFARTFCEIVTIDIQQLHGMRLPRKMPRWKVVRAGTISINYRCETPASGINEYGIQSTPSAGILGQLIGGCGYLP